MLELWPYIVAAAIAVFAFLKGKATSDSKWAKEALQKEAEAARARAEAIRETKGFKDQAQGLTDEDALKEALEWSEQR